jgi:uncharacterized protein with ParB-like and HNH nuclease domain
MKASETTLRNLLEGGKQFQIPLFQRPYSWNEENWNTLWEDLMSIYNEEVKGYFFLGPIVTQAILGTADGISPFIVIDGQQRLTTLTIILAALRSFLKKNDKEMAEEIDELYLRNKFKKNDDIYKVLPTQDDRETYKSIILSKQAKDIKKEGQIYAAYNFFEKKLKTPNPEDDVAIDYAKFKNILLEKLLLVNITTDDNDNPYLIFESLNNKGEELTQVDLVRNYIFMRLTTEERQEIYDHEWLPFIEGFKESFGDKKYVLEVTKAFWFYLRKDGEDVIEKEVYKNIKKQFDKSEDGVKNELLKLIKFATYYQRLSHPEKEPESRLKERFIRLKRLDFTTCHIFLLNVYHEYEEERLTVEQFQEILGCLESYFVRRLFTGVPTNTLGKIFNNLYGEVKNQKSNNLVEGLHEVLSSYDKRKIWPEDNAFREGIINYSIYTPSQIDRTKLILEILESSFGKEKVKTDNVSIEHIMPQNLSPEWKKMLGVNSSKVHKKCLHTLGNLTLILQVDNSKISNKYFSDKLIYFNDSNLSLNKYFKNLDQWNEETIRTRAESLADIAIKIWSR